MQNYWKKLSVKPNSTSAQIRSAYLAAMQKAHPDKGGSKEQAAIVNHAYEVLGTEESRQQYNEQRRAWASEIGASLCRCGHDARGKLNQDRTGPLGNPRFVLRDGCRRVLPESCRTGPRAAYAPRNLPRTPGSPRATSPGSAVASSHALRV
jgi:curved DNA-binding protein CbpA